MNNCMDLDKRCANDKRFAHPTLAVGSRVNPVIREIYNVPPSVPKDKK